jgi:hypothetical protein
MPAITEKTKTAITTNEARAIAKEAYIFGFPLVDNYRIQYAYFVDQHNSEYKGAWNEVHNTARVYTPEDKTVQTPNSDTPYSMAGVDLRTEPLVFTVPLIDGKRYYSLQFIDMYCFNFAYVGSRSTGNDAGSFLLAGPNWKGEKPGGIREVIQCETELAFIIYRTQLFNAADIENVKNIQAGYQLQALSKFLNKPAPAAAPSIDFIKPLTDREERTSLQFFGILNFVLQFCPTHESEKELMDRFAKLNIGGNKNFDPESFLPDINKAIEDGMADAWQSFEELKKNYMDTFIVKSGDMVGTREFLQNNYLFRMAAAELGIYGNSKEEAMYPVYFIDDDGEKPNGANKYRLRFAPGQLPPVNAFWSLTMYQLPESLLYANELNRYLINSSMLPNLWRDNDGGVSIYIQHESPGKNHESNWLPAPAGPFFVAMRLYWPKQDAVNGTWKQPALKKRTD